MRWISVFFLISLAHAKSWDGISDPGIMVYHFKKKFFELPLSAKLPLKENYWSGDYWALNQGNINYRWNARKKTGFGYKSPTQEEAQRMSILELSELSPSEKYDLFTGSYDYPLKNEVNKIADPEALIWEGICHGFSPASMNHKEPRPKLMRNKDGIDIPFGSTDIKALLSYYYAYGYRSPDTHQVGRRCFKDKANANTPECIDDLNSGAFHLILSNRLGLEKKSLIADFERYEQVWNHPIVSYDSKVIKESPPRASAASSAMVEVHLKTALTYVDRNGNDWLPVIGTKLQSYKTVSFEYTIEVDSEGNIVGGEWISERRPDFLWYTLKPRRFEGSLSQLGELLNE